MDETLLFALEVSLDPYWEYGEELREQVVTVLLDNFEFAKSLTELEQWH
jgi:hypothetical protein